jgi:hypothetical protein
LHGPLSIACLHRHRLQFGHTTSLLPACLAGSEQPDPSWSSSVEGWGHLSPGYLAVLNRRGAAIKQGWHFLTAICEGTLYTQYLRRVRHNDIATGGVFHECLRWQYDTGLDVDSGA